MKLKGLQLAQNAHKESFTAACWVAELLGNQQATVCMDDVTRYISPDALGNAAGGVFRGEQWELVTVMPSLREGRRGGYQGHWSLKRSK
jgi:hypothetical protein